jgi:5-(aminomethyl)-3-furanmethanol phosphate kinase
MDWVVKIGGSLFPENAINLCEKLASFAGLDVLNKNESVSSKKILIISGGGSFANKVRDYDEDMGFSNTANHNAAILCMDILGTLLADKVEGLKAVYSIEESEFVADQGGIPVLIPSRIMNRFDPLEHSWRVSSDSISLYLSDLLKAKLLIATDVDGIYTHDPSHDDAKLIKNISAKKLLNFGETSVDEFLPELLLGYKSDCYVVNGKHPDRVISIIEGRSSKYTLIGGN